MPMNINNDDSHYETLIEIQSKLTGTMVLLEIMSPVNQS